MPDRPIPPLVADGGPFVHHDPQATTDGEGSLDGWDVAIKDLVAIAGVSSSAGLADPLRPAADTDAPIVAMLRSAGARIVGTTALHQLACGVTGINGAQGTPINPGAPDRCPGGSGSGSAAVVAAGMARMAIGSDTGGSVRVPSAACGVVGWKPEKGRIPLDGVIPCAPSLDHVGVHTTTVSDALTSLAVLGVGGVDGARPATPGTLGVVRRELDSSESVVRDAVDTELVALTEAGWSIVDVDWPDADDIARTSTTVLLGEFARVHADERPALDERLGADIASRLDRGAAITDAAIDDALVHCRDLRAHVDAAFASVDAVVGPTLPILAPLVEDARSDDGTLAVQLVAHTRLANCTGHPAVTIPLPAAIPVGLQLIGSTDAALAPTALAVESIVR